MVHFAKRLNDLHGKRVWRFPVEITMGEDSVIYQECLYRTGTVHVTSLSARDALGYVRDALGTTPCVEVNVYGPKGGVAAHAYWGFESAIGAAMFGTRRSTAKQLTLFG